jgi:transcriptional regulator with XRE-family HTH domain
VHISDLERGSREVGLKTLHALSRALEVKLETLFKGID